MAVRVFHRPTQYLRSWDISWLGYVRLAAVLLSLPGIGFLLWFYTYQNALTAAAFHDIAAQVNSDSPLTPADLADLSHQVCVLDAEISNIESFFQPLGATMSSGGWCGNYTRVFIRFAKEAGYPAHKLHIQSGGRSHTLAEVYFDGKWRIIDPFFNQVYLLPDGEMATFEDLRADPRLLRTPRQRPLNNPALERIYKKYVPIFPVLYRDAADFYPGLEPSAFYHNTLVLLSYPLSIFYEGERRPFVPGWLDRQELLGAYALSLVFLLAIVPTGMSKVRSERKKP